MVETVLDAFVAAFRLLFYFADWFARGKERRIVVSCYDLKDDKLMAQVTLHRFRTRLKVGTK